jgi:TfoX/Sxy family transcriptional regulator of competence genes
VSVPRPAQKYRPDVLAAVSELLSGRPDVTPMAMFGHPGFAVGGKLFAFLYDAGLALKISEERVQKAITRPDVTTLSAYGKAMRAWVYVEHDDAAAYDGDLDLMDAAITHVARVAAKPTRARAPRKRRAAQA